jgi:hypothetical protein
MIRINFGNLMFKSCLDDSDNNVDNVLFKVYILISTISIDQVFFLFHLMKRLKNNDSTRNTN